MNKLRLNTKELVAAIAAAEPGTIGEKMRPKLATHLLRSAFGIIQAEVEKAGDGTLKVGGLGVFRVRTVERGEGSERVTRRVVKFRTGKPAAQKKQKDKRPGPGA